MNSMISNSDDTPQQNAHADENVQGQTAANDGVVSKDVVLASEVREGTVYETKDSLHMYLGLQYPCSGKEKNLDLIFPHENAPWHAVGFPQRVARILVSLLPKESKRALDIGCAVGGSSFELAKTFEQVHAFDYSQSFINAAKQMQANEVIRFQVSVEAELYEEVTAVPDPDVTEVMRNRVQFFTGDACK